ncbi:MAG: MarR family transcriptional regulator [Symploca sp. SIO2G7]|nr:MarR family transcriptional regulator [Symploca sp. SIO2G7]
MTHNSDGRQTSSHFRLTPAKGTEQNADKQAPKSARHYRLTNDEWLQACTELKPAEIKVLYYLRTLDPWGDKDLEISVTKIANELKCNKGTVSRALKALDADNWINLEINTATVKLHTKNSSTVQVLSVDNGLPQDNTVVSGSQVLSTDNFDDRQTTPMIVRQHLTSETNIQQGFQIALNSLNDLDSLNREKKNQNSNFRIEPDYRDWLLAKASRLPDPPALRELWLEKQSINPANLREYEAWQSVQQQIDPLSPPLPPAQPDVPDVDIAARLARYQKHWAVIPMRKGIQHAISAHPEWHIDIGPDGPRWLPDPPEHRLALDPTAIRQRIKNAIAMESPITPQLQADAERCRIDIPMLQSEWELAASPPGSTADDIYRAG